MTDRAYIVSRMLETKIAIAENNDQNILFITPDVLKEILALLKEQDERYKNMVISWLREIALNNVDCNRNMTFLDAIENIHDRALYGLEQYFRDKQEGR